MLGLGKADKKIIISFTIVIFLVVLLGSIASVKMMLMFDLTQRFHKHPFTVTISTHTIQMHLVSMHRYMKDVVLSQNEEDLTLALKRVADDEKIIYHEFDTVFKNYLGSKEEVDQTYRMFKEWKPIRDNIVRLMRENKRDEAIAMNKSVAYDHVNGLNKSVNRMIDFAYKKAHTFMAHAEETKEYSIAVMILLMITISILIIIIMFVLIKSLRRIEAVRQKQEETLFEQSRLAQMGELISMIAHQWRQPLSSIAASVSSLQVKQALDSCDEKTLIQQLEDIADVTQYLSGTIDDFRNFYKPDKERVKVQLEQVVLKSINIMKGSFASMNIKLIQSHACSEKIAIHENEIVQVVLNLLKNACDNFSEKETKNAYIKISTTNNTIMVCDNGGGITDDIINRVFDPYFSTKHERNGTGLGLYMSKIIVEEHHNGRLEVRNNEEGACFTILLN